MFSVFAILRAGPALKLTRTGGSVPPHRRGRVLLYDAAIIGAGVEGLTAAVLLARAGLRVCIVERGERAGGRCLAREFHPGYRASPFADQIRAIPPALYWELDLARHGAIFAPDRHALAVSGGRRSVLPLTDDALFESAALVRRAEAGRMAILARLERDAVRRRLWLQLWPDWLAPARGGTPSPVAEWAGASLADLLRGVSPETAAHLAAIALEGRTADPFLAGSALHLLALGASAGRLAGGPGRLCTALVSAAREAGAAFMLGVEATDILTRSDRVTGLGLADGREVAVRHLISTLDVKRTFLTHFSWGALPRAVMRDVHNFRVSGMTARVLFALAGGLDFAMACSGAIHIDPSCEALRAAHEAWREGVVADELPVSLRLISAGEPGLAPPSGAVVTATLGAVPSRLFDGAWTHEKRELLRRRALAAAESVWPGFGAHVAGCEVVAPPDIEKALGATDGDLDGGELAGDQMLDCGPWHAPSLPRTPVRGLYLAGSFLAAGVAGSGVAGAMAARAVLADRRGIGPR